MNMLIGHKSELPEICGLCNRATGYVGCMEKSGDLVLWLCDLCNAKSGLKVIDMKPNKLEEIEAILHKAQVPATRIFTVADIFNDPHYRARKAIVNVADEHMGEVAMAGVVPRLSDTPGIVRHAGRDVGQDSREVLRDVLGLADGRIDELTKSGVIATARPMGDAN